MHEPIVPKPDHHRFIDLTGQTFGRLAVVSYAGKKGNTTSWNCYCQCGALHTARGNHLKAGRTKSCGCSGKTFHITHGVTGSPEYRSWQSAKQRCTNPKGAGFESYGGRGITFCDRWMNSLENFLLDMGPRPAGTSLDRIDNDGGYYKENCRWATRAQQSRNMRVHRLSKTGVAGVLLRKNGKYMAKITANDNTIHIGIYADRWQAICARKSAELTHW